MLPTSKMHPSLPAGMFVLFAGYEWTYCKHSRLGFTGAYAFMPVKQIYLGAELFKFTCLAFSETAHCLPECLRLHQQGMVWLCIAPTRTERVCL